MSKENQLAAKTSAKKEPAKQAVVVDIVPLVDDPAEGTKQAPKRAVKPGADESLLEALEGLLAHWEGVASRSPRGTAEVRRRIASELRAVMDEHA